MAGNLTIKNILLFDQNWARFVDQYHERTRPSILYHVVKLLSCRLNVNGYQIYCCSNSACSHRKKVPFTCKGKACSSCGRKSTAKWINKQHDILPQTTWQHITLTMPDCFWDLFWLNRWLLKKLPAIGANVLLDIAKKKGLTIGIFLALHTFGRQMNRNVHLHLSSTLGGLTADGQWKSLYFVQHTIMKMWRMRVVRLFRKAAKAKQLILPATMKAAYNTYTKVNKWLDEQYSKYWRANCSPPSKSHKHNVDYLGQYTKRPPIANSRILSYDGNTVSFRYFDHKDRCYKTLTCSAFLFIRLWIQHLPDKGFRMIRYYGFLANQKRGKLLPLVYSLLGQPHITQLAISFAALMQQTFGVDPMTCILCDNPMVPACTHWGLNITQLMLQHRTLALSKNIRA